MIELRKDFLPFCLPDITEAEIDEVVQTLKSGWLAKGPRTIEFEKQFCQYVGSKYAIGVNSCTSALHIALLAAGIKQGDEVITSPMTFAASANTIIHVGATPVFVDIDERDGCIDASLIEKKITSKTKAIVPVHYAGQACDLDTIYALAEKYGLFVSEDAAHAIHTQYNGRMIGNSSPGAVSYSFYATKNLSTGEGGILTTDNEEIAKCARMLVTHGMDHNAWNRYVDGGSWMYDIVEPGYKYNMFDLQAALGLIQLKRLESMQSRREEIVRIYNEGLKDIEGLTIPQTNAYTTTNAWHLYMIRVDESKIGKSRNRLIDEINSRNIGTSVHFIPVHYMSAYKKLFGFEKGDYPKTESWFDRIISLPLYTVMSNQDAYDVVEAVRDSII